tara:strand:- start:74 stop:496 length:423 start_codon:yes stop_codon:yes gene_type:complete
MAKSKVSFFEQVINPLHHKFNNSKLIAGLGMIILNLFSKYVVFDISKSQEAFIKNTLTRELLIFVIAFVGTRELILSLFLTATFVVLSRSVFNEQSRFCIIPEKYKKLNAEIDINKDGKISDKEIERAKEILRKANKQGI